MWSAAHALVLTGAVLGVALSAAAQPARLPEAPPTPAANWSRPLVGIGALRADADGDFVPDRSGEEALVAGRVTAGTGLVRADIAEVYIQDGTGGLRLILAPGSPPMLAGDSVLVHGIVGHRLGMLEMVAPNVRVVPGRSRTPTYKSVDVVSRPGGGRTVDLESHEGELVEVSGTVLERDSLASGTQMVILSGTTLLSVWAYRLRAQPITFSTINVGDYVRVRGVAVQHDPFPPFSGSYVVYPLAESDVDAVGIPPSMVRMIALGTAALLLGALLWAGILRSQVQRRTRALQVSESRYGHLFDAAADPVLVLDAARGGLVVQANLAAQRAFGVDADGSRSMSTESAGTAKGGVGRPLALSEIAADADEVLHHIEVAVRRGDATSVLELHRADGRAVPFEFASRRLRSDREGETVLVAVARDVEERRLYELGLLEAMQQSDEARAAADDAREAAEEANRLKATILANMSHELRTPMTAILGFADILREEVPPDLYEYADTIKTGGERLLATLNDLFELSQLDGGVSVTVTEPIDAVKVVRQAVLHHAAEAKDKSVGLRFASDVTEAPVMQPSEGLERVARVLIGNAVKFTERGEVRVSFHTAPDFVALRVQDTGVGIGAAFIPRLYEPFTQESGGHSRSFEGNGLGLAIAKRYVDQMGGEIRVWSRPGEGTLFEVALPRSAATDTPGADPDAWETDTWTPADAPPTRVEDGVTMA